jgi:PIN domain nuclease of toxin-antitoxin system
MIYLDTHVAVWLVTGKVERLSSRAREAIDAEDCLISPAVTLEMQYLHEVGRLSIDGQTALRHLEADIGLKTCDIAFARVVHEALALKWTRDPFDRIISATALVRGVPLVTKDATIRRHCRRAIWD